LKLRRNMRRSFGATTTLRTSVFSFSPRLAPAAPLAVVVALLATAPAAHAQRFKGDAYGADVSIAVPIVELGVGVKVVDNPDLPVNGGGPFTNNLLNAGLNAGANTVTTNLFTVLGANTINTSTQGLNGTATSFTLIEGLSLYPSFNIGLNLPIVGNTGLNLGLGNSLVTADVIRSTTQAFGTNNNVGRTEIANLRFGGVSLGNIDTTSALSTTYYLTLGGAVSTTANANVLLPDIAQLVINEQTLSDGGSTRTTNALVLKVLPNGLITTGAGRVGQVTVASSTAGVVAPEPGSAALLTMAAVPFLGFVAIRRRRNLGSAS
jgi:hypothetical protein